ncbi:MAG: response regulator transcription factor [Bacteroidota bacterium]|nr:response regulator transcription factor [Bacteroidota bacterium]
MIRILIVDDHKIVRQGLRAIIKTCANMQVVSECTDGNEVEAIVYSKTIDIVLMDINMPKMDGIETTEILNKKHPEIKVIALSMESDYYVIQKMLKAGAVGYVLKTAGAADILEAIEKVYTGNNFFSKEVSNQIMASMMRPNKEKRKKQLQSDRQSVNRLTKREMEILKHIANEETNEEIGVILNISSGTVATHRRNLLQKLEVRNSIGLAKIAYQVGLV